MEVYCTRPSCPRPRNQFADLDDTRTFKTVQQKYCVTCGMPLILAGRYVPQKLLGQGGFGAAFLARDRYTPTMPLCVVKQFLPAGDLNPQQLALAQTLFEREGEVLEQLGNHHPQIPDLYAFFQFTAPDPRSGQQQEFFYLVQEFIDGETLESELAQAGKLSEGEVLKMLESILQVLQFVHEHGSIHRDIKPSNIMRHRNGQFYLLDFGAVKQVAKSGATGVGKGSTGIYSMGYAPPEQMASGNVFPSTDLYALAVTCMTLLTGKEPSDLLDSYSNRWNWRSYATVSDRLAEVLDRMLQPAPSDRFQSAAEVLTALTTRVSPITSPPPAAASPAGPPVLMPPVVAQPSVPTPSQPSSQAPARRRSSVAPFSTLEILAGAGFVGLEGGLLAIMLTSLLQPSFVSAGLVVLILGGMVLAQSRRMIERWDLVILLALTIGVVYFFPMLQFSKSFQTTMVLAGLSGLLAIAIVALFRLIYNLLLLFSKLF
ncbi:serine/threonine protein kinase [Leptolyngbya sp. 'hensonii']|uniref:serine/threonine-protein kinase n=1 Tax=Leptolyngbya sp. 'hensonii' TaxID=1922337 RepID=UPI00094F5818|nr:serine/threonine-protein kinase [Leptolyngbya sp. 'hensonii']OLP18988.1 serine/threonine protein kinase [Leptolyngbya sp. 'hensonii']